MPFLAIQLVLWDPLSVGSPGTGPRAHENWLLNVRESCEPVVNYRR